MNAAHISNAITAMGESVEILKSIPYTDRPTFEKKWAVIEKLRAESVNLKYELSNINIEATGGA